MVRWWERVEGKSVHPSPCWLSAWTRAHPQGSEGSILSRENSIDKDELGGLADCITGMNLLLILFYSFWVPWVFFTLLKITLVPSFIHWLIYPSIFLCVYLGSVSLLGDGNTEENSRGPCSSGSRPNSLFSCVLVMNCLPCLLLTIISYLSFKSHIQWLLLCEYTQWWWWQNQYLSTLSPETQVSWMNGWTSQWWSPPRCFTELICWFTVESWESKKVGKEAKRKSW